MGSEQIRPEVEAQIKLLDFIARHHEQKGQGEGFGKTIRKTATMLKALADENERLVDAELMRDQVGFLGTVSDCIKCLNDELEAAEARAIAAEEALEPFATFAETFVDEDGWTGPMKQERIVDWFGPSDFRRAAALAQKEGGS